MPRAATVPSPTGTPDRRRRRRVPPAATLAVAVGLLLLVAIASLAIGARQIPFDLVVQSFTAPVPGDPDQVVVRDLRLPRAVIGIMAGAALGVVAALLQGSTRNPLADPGLLGINAGASLAVVAAIAFLGVASPFGFIWFAFGGAALAAAVVFAIGSSGRPGGDPRQARAHGRRAHGGD